MGLDIILAIIGVISGGGLTALIARLSSGGKSYRNELRKDIQNAKTEIKELVLRLEAVEDEGEKWKERFVRVIPKLHAFRLTVMKLAIEKGYPQEVIDMIINDAGLDKLIEELEGNHE